MSNQKMLIVSNTQSMMTLSLKGKMEEYGYQATIVAGNIKNVTELKETYETVLLYLDESLAENMQVLVFIRDKCVEDNIALFLIGDQTEIDNVTKVMHKSSIAHMYERPVNVSEVAENISDYIKNKGLANKKKILVVDDSGAMLRNVKGWLEDKYQVILANSGAMAIKYLSLNRPDLVLLDYEMPVIDGAQVLEMIRTEMDFADIPVIFLTSKNDKESVANVVKLKVDGYMLKTMKPEDIVKQVDDFFMRQKSKMI